MAKKDDVSADIADLRNRVESLESWRAVVEAWRIVSEGEFQQRAQILGNLNTQLKTITMQLGAMQSQMDAVIAMGQR